MILIRVVGLYWGKKKDVPTLYRRTIFTVYTRGHTGKNFTVFAKGPVQYTLKQYVKVIDWYDYILNYAVSS